MSEWISVKKSLPKDRNEFGQSGYYLVTIGDGFMTTAWYEEQGKRWINALYNSGSEPLQGVTHWMPIPEPPKD